MQQPAFGLGNGFRTPKRGEKYLRMMIIVADFDAGERDHTDPGIFNLGPNQLGKVLLDLICDAAEPGGTSCHLSNKSRVRSGLRSDCPQPAS